MKEKRKSYRNPVDRFFLVNGKRPLPPSGTKEPVFPVLPTVVKIPDPADVDDPEVAASMPTVGRRRLTRLGRD
jgi:hypothetical protein